MEIDGKISFSCFFRDVKGFKGVAESVVFYGDGAIVPFIYDQERIEVAFLVGVFTRHAEEAAIGDSLGRDRLDLYLRYGSKLIFAAAYGSNQEQDQQGGNDLHVMNLVSNKFTIFDNTKMIPAGQWNLKIFEPSAGFEELSLEIFRFQYAHNPVYRAYTDVLQIAPDRVSHLQDIPFLPIRLFKTQEVKTTLFSPALIFESSGTTGMTNSRHYVKDPALYDESFLRGFRLFYGPPADWCIIGLLPSYLERQHSSLVYMVDKLVKLSGHPQSGFYLHDYARLAELLSALEKKGQKTILIGVSFALLDLAEQFPQPLQHTILMETGGMKGRREELVRPALHERLRAAFGVSSIHSEYGMTELLSQAYSKGDGVFECPPWMRVLVRDDEDPLQVTESGTGGINIIDLANIYSCSFIATDDAGRVEPTGRFEIAGRLDGSDLRGCSLLIVPGQAS